MEARGLNVPVLANVYVLGGASARFFHAGKIPGCVVTDDLLALTDKHASSPDHGKAFFLEFAAKQCAIAKGLGYRGAYLGGHLSYADYARILEIVATFAPDDWKLFAREIRFHQPDQFYFFEADQRTGLSSPEINREYLASKTPERLAEARKSVSLEYKFNRVVHDRIFERNSSGFEKAKGLVQIIKKHEWQESFHRIEHALKILAFDCRDCGDCSLPDIAYLCPESQCAKNQRNGPCGGTRDSKCEVGEKRCIWARAYERLKAYGEEEEMLHGPPVAKNGALKGTSAWLNTFLGLDHHAAKGSSK
jgi:methylenetetrahydrofolate reductase (NADPH)